MHYFAGMLEFEHFKKKYGEKTVLDFPRIFFPGGLHWIQGKNGSGKSTLFRCIAGMAPFEGSIRINGCHQGEEPVRFRQKVTYSEAEPLFPGFLSGKEILQFVGEARNASELQMKKLIDDFSLSLFFDNPASTYSSGMAKKMSLVMAFLGQPELILLDEPFITLDMESLAVLSSYISDCRWRGISFLLSSHPDFRKDGFSADQCWYLENGQVLEQS